MKITSALNSDQETMMKFMTLLYSLIDEKSDNAPYPRRWIETGEGTKESLSTEYLIIDRMYKKTKKSLEDGGIAKSELKIKFSSLYEHIDKYTEKEELGFDMGVMRLFNEQTLSPFIEEDA